MDAQPLYFSWEWWEVFVGGVATIAIFSFLYRENPFYRAFEHFYIGIATSLGIFETIRDFFWPRILKPMFGIDRLVLPDGTYAEPYNRYYLLYLIPIVFGSLYYFILSKRHNWLAQVVIGFSFGVAGGAAFRGLFSEMLPQLYDSFRPLYVPGDRGHTVSNLIFLFTLFSALSYFFFTFKRQPGGLIERSSLTGRWMLMGCFGAYFGSTIMARMALLVERLDFLLHKWLPILWG